MNACRTSSAFRYSTKTIICEPMLEAVDFQPYLQKQIEQVVVGGESGNDARLMRV